MVGQHPLEVHIVVRIHAGQQNMDKTYCVFGDSVTQVAYVKEGWVRLLREYLEDKYKDDFISVFNLGVGGDTTEDILKRLEGEAAARKPNIILLAVGINDTKYYDPNRFKVNLERLAEIASGFTKKIIFVGLVLGDWKGEEPFGQDRTIKYNELIKEVAELKGCKFISLDGVLTPKDFTDGLHPNEQGHRKMFEEIRKHDLS